MPTCPPARGTRLPLATYAADARAPCDKRQPRASRGCRRKVVYYPRTCACVGVPPRTVRALSIPRSGVPEAETVNP